ncbi:hypothetical protein [Sphingorhabdus sp. YGSMI21]|uniref:hypothetical protein n=1 Tax=Sphingorhabdus sp. YGSMI21 TaxID=2077182 RepID=UPI000C1E2F5A|nr:hypothetical protein [Sphingorhabdus sp. YGSMI21]ATW04315.1 hypothetical protein CHN51_12790 [Sphingorhabdus sp. YGSMI21]
MLTKLKMAGLIPAAALALILASSPAAAECVIGSAPLFDPFAPYKEPGSIIHKESGFIFPAAIAGFRRQCEMTTDFSGNNFEIGYLRDFEGHEIEIRIAIIHLEELNAQDHYQIVKPDLLSQYSSAAVVSEGDYFVSGRPDITAYQGIFDGDKDTVPWHFSVTALDYGYWDARLTASYPQEIDTAAQEAIMELIAAFQWQTPVDLATEVAVP